MISFVTFFLLLVFGTHPVQVAVDSRVAWVEFRLDGVLVGRADGEPWTVDCDFGFPLRPHELVATAFGDQGQQLGSVRQWINMPRPDAEVGVILERDGMGFPVAARVTWKALGDDLKTKVTATLDGSPLIVEDPRRIALPDMPRDQSHVLTVRVDFGDGVEASEEIAFGGLHGSEITSELTAVPVAMTHTTKMPPIEELHGQFSVNGQPVRALGIERNEGQIVIVRDGNTNHPTAAWDLVAKAQVAADTGKPSSLKTGDRIRFISPFTPAHNRNSLQPVLFPTSKWFTRYDIPRLLAQIKPPLTKGMVRTVADSVAVAGVEAARGNHPRAVVLLLGKPAEDHSTHSPTEARQFLDDLKVPLFVWRLGRDEHPSWPGAEYVAFFPRLTDAIARVRRSLDSQRIVWLEGHHLPQSVRITGATDRLRLVGGFEDSYPHDEQVFSGSVAADAVPTPLTGSPTMTGEEEEIVAAVDAVVRDRDERPITSLERENSQYAVGDVETPRSQALPTSGSSLPLDEGEEPEFAGSVEVRLATINVTVLDKKNQPVSGLDPDDFVLFVDDQRQDITNFTEVREGKAILKTVPPPTQAGQHPEENATTVTTQPEPRLLAVIVDSDNISVFNRNLVLKRARDFIEDSVHPPHLGMVLTNERYPKVRCPPTTSSAEIIAALTSLLDTASGASANQNAIRFVEDMINERGSGNGIKRDSLIALSRMTASQIDDSLKRSVGTLKTICRALGGFEGRKDVLYISDGLPMTPGEELFRLIDMKYDRRRPGDIHAVGNQSVLNELHTFNRATLFEELANQAVAADLTLHTIDARGLITEHDSPADSREHMPVNIGYVKSKNYQEPLRYLSAKTGGIAIVNTNEFEKKLERVEEAITRYYSLGFRLGPPRGDVLHTITIDLPNHPENKTRYRRRLLERSAETLAGDRTMSGLFVKPQHNSLDIEIKIEGAIPEGNNSWKGEVVVEIPSLNLIAARGSDVRTATLSVFAVAASEKGRSPMTRTRQSVVLPSDRSAALELQLNLNLDPGFNRVSIGVLDETSGFDGFAVAETSLPE